MTRTHNRGFRLDRRTLLRLGGAGLFGLPLLGLRSRRARGADAGARARRLIIFYFPDGVPGQSQAGDASLWHPTGGETSFTLPPLLGALAPYRDLCTFFRGLSMGPTDSGSHPGGAKKLLTAVDGGQGASIDQVLAATVGADLPYRQLYLGAQALQNGASGDQFISYVAPGQTATPDDDPVAAFQRLFGSGGGGSGGDGGGTGSSGAEADARRSILDTATTDLADLRGRLGPLEKQKLELHLDALRELEARLGGGAGGGGASCQDPAIDTDGITGDTLYAPERCPQVLTAQIDLMVQAMACGLTRVGVLQCSHHTSELLMSRFMGSPMYDPGFDMRSHQASHYGARHDESLREFHAYHQQVAWWVGQFVYLLDRLAERPEGDGTMLDYSLCLLCSEICDGNTHLHDDMPFVLAGGGGGAIRPGRLLDLGYRRHGALLAALGRAMGADMTSFGDGTPPMAELLA